MLTPHLSVCMSAAANNSHSVTLSKDEYVGIGSYRLMRRGVIQLSPSEYYLLKTAFGVVDAGILERVCFWKEYAGIFGKAEIRDTKFSIMKKRLPPLNLRNKKPPRPIDIHADYSNLPKEVKQIVKRQKVDKIWFFPASDKKLSTFRIDLNTADKDWHSFFILNAAKEFVLPGSKSL